MKLNSEAHHTVAGKLSVYNFKILLVDFVFFIINLISALSLDLIIAAFNILFVNLFVDKITSFHALFTVTSRISDIFSPGELVTGQRYFRFFF
jgi:hypothetical protein